MRLGIIAILENYGQKDANSCNASVYLTKVLVFMYGELTISKPWNGWVYFAAFLHTRQVELVFGFLLFDMYICSIVSNDLWSPTGSKDDTDCSSVAVPACSVFSSPAL